MFKNDLSSVKSKDYRLIQEPLRRQLAEFGLDPKKWKLVLKLRQTEALMKVPVELRHRDDEKFKIEGLSSVSLSAKKLKKVEWLKLSIPGL